MDSVVIAAEQLKAAGHIVTPANGIPGLWNVSNLAHDVTSNQLCDLARMFGAPIKPKGQGGYWQPGGV